MFLPRQVTVKGILVGTENAADIAPELLLPGDLTLHLFVGFVPLQKLLVPLPLEVLLEDFPVVQRHSTETAVVLVPSGVSLDGAGAGALIGAGIHLHKGVLALHSGIICPCLMAQSLDVNFYLVSGEDHVAHHASKHLLLYRRV